MVSGPELAAWRKARGLSQARLAELLGVDKFTISRWERDARAPSHPETLRRALRDVDRELAALRDAGAPT